jgi:hypothetical protein
MVPTAKELKSVLTRALEMVPGSKDITFGQPLDMKKPIGDLLKDNIRFFLFDRIHPNENKLLRWERGDSYGNNPFGSSVLHNLTLLVLDPKEYNTSTADPIISCLQETLQNYSRDRDDDRAFPSHPPRGTIYQLQATPTAKITSDIAASFTWSDASSLLVYTKAVMDRETYPWIARHKFREPGEFKISSQISLSHTLC